MKSIIVIIAIVISANITTLAQENIKNGTTSKRGYEYFNRGAVKNIAINSVKIESFLQWRFSSDTVLFVDNITNSPCSQNDC